MALCSWPNLLSGGSFQSCIFIGIIICCAICGWVWGSTSVFWPRDLLVVPRTDSNANFWIQLCRALSAVPMEHRKLNIMLDKVAIYHEPKVCFFLFDISDSFDGRTYTVSVHYERMQWILIYSLLWYLAFRFFVHFWSMEIWSYQMTGMTGRWSRLLSAETRILERVWSFVCSLLSQRVGGCGGGCISVSLWWLALVQ